MGQVVGRMIAGALLALIAMGCQAVGKAPPPGKPPTNPDAPGRLTMEMIQEDLKTNGKKVLVLFSKEGEEETGPSCPVKIRTVDSVCTNDSEFGSDDPSVICRVASDRTGNKSLKRIVWRSRGEEPDRFKVIFEGGYMPCKSGWTGDTFQARHVCKLKTKARLGIGNAGAVYVKYTIVGEDGLCPALDPYFIVRH